MRGSWRIMEVMKEVLPRSAQRIGKRREFSSKGEETKPAQKHPGARRWPRGSCRTTAGKWTVRLGVNL